MTHGRPDWTSSINITGQDLEEVISRPKYGSAQYLSYLATIYEAGHDSLYTIDGTGMLYGGYIKHVGSFLPDKILLMVVIDGYTIGGWDIESLNEYQIESKNMDFFFEQYYSEENDKYIQGINRDITFEESFSVHVWNLDGSGGNDAVAARLTYALI